MKTKTKYTTLFSVVFISTLIFATYNISAQCAPVEYPPAKLGHSMVYDSLNDVIIFYGGATGRFDLDRKYDTRSYDVNNNDWTNLNPSEHPYPSSWGAMAYDSESAEVVQFGGVPQNDYASDETWIYNPELNSWTLAEPEISPPLRSTHVMAYDSESDVIILHGGALSAEDNPSGVYVKYNDTWAYDLNSNTWTNLNPTGLSVGLAEAQMTYDSESDRCIMVGGYFVYPYDNPLEEYFASETWAYDFNSNNWENITTPTHPEQRYDHALTYDSESDRVILVGGHTIDLGNTIANETWAFDYNSQSWVYMNANNNPVRLGHQIAYDTESDLVILFGGLSEAVQTASFYNDIFAYNYNNNTWIKMSEELCPTPIEDTIFHMIPVIASISIIAVIVIVRKKQ